MTATYTKTELGNLSDALAAARAEVGRLDSMLRPVRWDGYPWSLADRKRIELELNAARARVTAALGAWEAEALKREDVIYPEDRAAIIARRARAGI